MQALIDVGEEHPTSATYINPSGLEDLTGFDESVIVNNQVIRIVREGLQWKSFLLLVKKIGAKRPTRAAGYAISKL